jgi:hypothetical protein
MYEDVEKQIAVAWIDAVEKEPIRFLGKSVPKTPPCLGKHFLGKSVTKNGGVSKTPPCLEKNVPKTPECLEKNGGKRTRTIRFRKTFKQKYH